MIMKIEKSVNDPSWTFGMECRKVSAMTPGRWQIVERIFNEALAYPAAERAKFIESTCGGDEELKIEITSLLAAEADLEAEGDSRASLVSAAAAEWAASDQPTIVGREIDSYRVVSMLGAGGMGEVYLAEDTTLDRRVALKLLPLAFNGDPGRLRRFTEEARAASALNHPNIITVYRIGDVDGRRYIATEFIDGATLRERLERGPLPPLEAIDIAIQTAGALRAAHAAGIIHRDIKPENLMIRHDGYVKVLDFGLAKLGDGDQLAEVGAAEKRERVTRVGTVLGTLNYMAPEQARGGTVDARADLFSVTVVLHEMLTGVIPHTDTNESPRIPRVLADVIRRGLAVDPAERIQSADELKDALEKARTALTEAPSRARRRARSAVAAGLVAIAIAAAPMLWNRLFTSSIQSLAVLPFTSNQPESGDLSYLAVGLADAIGTRLGEVPQLKLPPTATVRHFINTARVSSDVGRELSVESVLTGSVTRSGDRLHVVLRLTRVKDGAELWNGKYDESFSNVFTMRDAITEKVASTLVKDVGKMASHPRRETGNSVAYDLYLQGREQWARRTPQAVRAAIDLFQRSLNAEPSFALAYSSLADAYALTASGLQPSERFPKAKSAALKALDLDEGLPDAHNALAFISYKWEWRWDFAEQEFNRALQLQPNHVLARQWFSEFLSIEGRHDAAFAGFAKARQLDPYSTAIMVDQAAALARAGRGEEAADVLRKGLAQEPNSAALYNGLYAALWSAHQDDEAFAALIRSRELSGATEESIAKMRAAYERGGFAEVARADVVPLIEADRTGQPPPAYYSRLSLAGAIARQFAVMGDRDEAFRWLEEATRRHDDGPLTLRTMWYWKPYRDDPRFKAIEQQVGMPAVQ